MALGRLWAGRAYGTNTGNLFVKLEGSNSSLEGRLHLNEAGVGLVVYAIKGIFDGSHLALTGEPLTEIPNFIFGQLTANATLNNKGELAGEWETNIGSAGTFILFPHEQAQNFEAMSEVRPDQFHTARNSFGAIEVDRRQITSLADDIQREFKNAQVVVTINTETEQSRFLPDFKNYNFNSERAISIKLFAQEAEANGLNKVVTVEFGQQTNIVTTQGGDEAWVLGMLEKLKRSIKPCERTYTTSFKRFGFGINQLLLVGAIVFLPSLESLRDRAVLMLTVLLLIYGVNRLHSRYLPFSAIYLDVKPIGPLARMAPTVISWVISVTASIAAALVAAYLQGWLGPPSPQ